jgi:hypothetical protein
MHRDFSFVTTHNAIRFVGHPILNATLALSSRIFTLFVPLWTLLFIVYHWPAQGAATNQDTETMESSSSSSSSSSYSSSSSSSSYAPSSSSAPNAFPYLSSNTGGNDDASRSYTRAQRDDDEEEEDGSVYVTNVITSPNKAYAATATIANLSTPTPFALPSSSVSSQQQQPQPQQPQRLNFTGAGGDFNYRSGGGGAPRSIGRPTSGGFGFGSNSSGGAHDSAHTDSGHGRSVLPLTPVSMSPPSDVDDNSPHFTAFGGGSGGHGNAGAFRGIVGQPRIGQMAAAANAHQGDASDDVNGSGSGSADGQDQNDLSSRLLSS